MRHPMHLQFDVASLNANPHEPARPSSPGAEAIDLLRQILEVQREHLTYLKATHDAGSRWRAFLARWREDFPDLHASCREAIPVLERAYGALMAELAEH